MKFLTSSRTLGAFVLVALGALLLGEGSAAASDEAAASTGDSATRFNTHSTRFNHGGAGGYGTVALDDLLTAPQALTSFSVSFWIKSLNPAPSQDYGVGLSNKLGIGCLDRTTLRFMSFSCFCAADVKITDPYVWHHVVATYDASSGSDHMKLYVNAGTPATADETTSFDVSDQAFLLGRFSGWDDGQVQLDEVASWESTLSAAEVTAIYNGGKPRNIVSDFDDYASASDLRGYWRLGDDYGSHTWDPDQSAGGHFMTLVDVPADDYGVDDAQ